MVFITLFSLIKNRNISFVCLQDPSLFQDNPLRAPGFQVHYYSKVVGKKTRMAIYVNLMLSKDFTYLCFTPAAYVFYLLLSRTNRVNVVGVFDKFSFINTYNRQIGEVNTVSLSELFTIYRHPVLIVEELNVHNLYSDPERDISSSDRRRGEQYFFVAGLHSYAIINEPGVYTKTPDTPLQRPSVIDYTLANRYPEIHIKYWKTNIAHTGSDHKAIVTTIATKSFTTAKPALAWEKITWPIDRKPSEVMKEELRRLMDFEAEPGDSPSFRETKKEESQLAVENFEYNLSLLIHTVKKHAPTKRPC